MRITADTSILVRTNVKATGPARELFDAIQQCAAVLVLSDFLISEVERVLRYPRIQAIYNLDEQEIRQHVEHLKTLGEMVVPVEGPPIVLNDPDDDPVIYTALAGGADIICTLDRHFYEPEVLGFCARYAIQVMTDLELLLMLRGELSEASLA